MSNNSFAVEITSGIISSIFLASCYKVYRYARRHNLWFLQFQDDIYKINNAKEEKLVETSILKIENKINTLTKQLNDLKKSKLIHDKNRMEEILNIVNGFERMNSLNNEKIEIVIDDVNDTFETLKDDD